MFYASGDAETRTKIGPKRAYGIALVRATKKANTSDMEQPDRANARNVKTPGEPRTLPRKRWLILAVFVMLALCMFILFSRGARRRVPADAVTIEVGVPIHGMQVIICPILLSNSTPRYVSVHLVGVQFKNGNSWSNSDILLPRQGMPVPPTNVLRNSIEFSAKPPSGPWRFRVILFEELRGPERIGSELREYVADGARAVRDKKSSFPITPFPVGLVLGHSNECFIESNEFAERKSSP